MSGVQTTADMEAVDIKAILDLCKQTVCELREGKDYLILIANIKDMLKMLREMETSPEFKAYMETMRYQETNSDLRAKMEKILNRIPNFVIDMESVLEQVQTNYQITAKKNTMLMCNELNQEIIPQFREYIERMLNNLNHEFIHGFRADMKKMLKNLDQEIFHGLRADMKKMLKNLDQEIFHRFRAYMERMLNNLNQAIIPFKANIETAILDDLPHPWNTNMTTMFNINHLEMISQFTANMNTMRRMQERETECNSQYGYNMLSWIMALSSEFAQGYWTELQNFVKKERLTHRDKIFPPEAEVFTWMKYCPLDQIKVVIIGQDPYPDPGEAHGLCFSVKKKKQKSPSLNKIFKELERDPAIKDFKIPDHGDLTSWAEQGVLLLNAVLTVRSGKAGSHKNAGWEVFTNRVVSLVSERNSEVVFLLWGEDAKQKRRYIDEEKHDILPTSHPSPQSARLGFDGCGHFSRTNELLRMQKKDPIVWQI